MFKALATILTWSALLPLAYAQSLAFDDAFNRGAYSAARDLALETPTADHFAFAARSALAEAVTMSEQTPPLELIMEAQSHARKALAEEASHAEGRLQLAIALSLEARGQSLQTAWRSGAGKTARKLAESVLNDDPNNSYAHGFLAVWHLEVRRRGGRFGASVMGASVHKAEDHYRLAAAADSQDAALHWQYARALTALNASKYRRKIDAALRASLAAKPRTDLERVMQARAATLFQILNQQPLHTAQLYAAKML